MCGLFLPLLIYTIMWFLWIDNKHIQPVNWITHSPNWTVIRAWVDFAGSSAAGVHQECRRPWFSSWVGKIPGRRDRLLHSSIHGLPWWVSGKASTHNAGDLGLISGLGRSLGGGHGKPLQYSGLENPHRQRSLAGSCPWGCTESDMIEQLSPQCTGLE